MAHYLVTAEPKVDQLDELKRKLQEDAFLDLQPFGRALTISLRNARVRENGKAVWEEEDYCNPPLAEEREAVLAHYFTNLEVEEVAEGEGWARIAELPFLLRELDKA